MSRDMVLSWSRARIVDEVLNRFRLDAQAFHGRYIVAETTRRAKVGPNRAIALVYSWETASVDVPVDSEVIAELKRELAEYRFRQPPLIIVSLNKPEVDSKSILWMPLVGKIVR